MGSYCYSFSPPSDVSKNESFPLSLCWWFVYIGKRWAGMSIGFMLTLANWQTCIWPAALCLSHPSNNKSMSTKREKKRQTQQFLEQAALLSHLGMSWGFGSEFALHGLLRVLSHFVAGKHSAKKFFAGLPGIKRWQSIWLDLLSSPKWCGRCWWVGGGWG